MTYDVLLICIKAYAEKTRIENESDVRLALLNAYYTGYYSAPSKHRKMSPDSVLNKMFGKKKDAGKEVNPLQTFKELEERYTRGRS